MFQLKILIRCGTFSHFHHIDMSIHMYAISPAEHFAEKSVGDMIENNKHC